MVEYGRGGLLLICKTLSDVQAILPPSSRGGDISSHDRLSSVDLFLRKDLRNLSTKRV